MNESQRSHRFRAAPWLVALFLLVFAYQAFVYRPGWEYQTGRYGSTQDDNDSALAADLKRLGSEGWEVVSADIVAWSTENEAPTVVRAVLRRRVRGLWGS